MNIHETVLQKFASLAVDNKVIYQRKRGFFVGICIEKGARSFVGKLVS